MQLALLATLLCSWAVGLWAFAALPKLLNRLIHRLAAADPDSAPYYTTPSHCHARGSGSETASKQQPQLLRRRRSHAMIPNPASSCAAGPPSGGASVLRPRGLSVPADSHHHHHQEQQQQPAAAMATFQDSWEQLGRVPPLNVLIMVRVACMHADTRRRVAWRASWLMPLVPSCVFVRT